jgi:fatty acid desaturase
MNFKIKGQTKRETAENVSYVLMAISALAVAVGIGIGSFVQYTVYIAVAGAVLFLPAIILYIISQLIGHEEHHKV